MIILLSCAKTMQQDDRINTTLCSEPIFSNYANEIISYMQKYSLQEIADILKVNQYIAKDNLNRYKNFNIANNNHAISAYSGIVFKKLNPYDFNKEDLEFAQKHLRITSFAYGLLKPLDLIKPYRLEGNISLAQLNNKSLFKFWSDKLTDILIKDINEYGKGELCNLASEEMKKLFDWKRLEKNVKIYSPKFKTLINGKSTTIVIHTKIARGETARWIIKQKVTNIAELKDYIG